MIYIPGNVTENGKFYESADLLFVRHGTWGMGFEGPYRRHFERNLVGSESYG